MVKIQKGKEVYDVPDEFLYGESRKAIGHVWASIENKKVRIGITDYGQKQLKEIVFVEIPEAGTTVEMLKLEGDTTESKPIGTVESQKTLIELYSPLSGTIEQINPAIVDNPSLINQDPYGDGWILLIKPSQLENEKESLWSAETYAEALKGF